MIVEVASILLCCGSGRFYVLLEHSLTEVPSENSVVQIFLNLRRSVVLKLEVRAREATEESRRLEAEKQRESLAVELSNLRKLVRDLQEGEDFRPNRGPQSTPIDEESKSSASELDSSTLLVTPMLNRGRSGSTGSVNRNAPQQASGGVLGASPDVQVVSAWWACAQCISRALTELCVLQSLYIFLQ